MKRSIQALVTGNLLLASMLGGGVAAADVDKANSDCRVSVSQLELVHGCFFTEGPGPGFCEGWVSHGPMYSAALTRTAQNNYEINNAELGLRVNVVYDGKDKAQVSIQAPRGVDQTQLLGATYENYDTAHRTPGVSTQATFRDIDNQLAYDYDVSCSFGLSDAVDSQEAADNAAMNALGPAQEWQDQAAPSAAVLPIGTVLELTQDMDIQPGSDTQLTRFVEQNGLMTEVGFSKLKLPYRFAFADFFNANNGYMYKTHYPKGMRLEVTKVVTNTFSSGGHSFDISLKLIGLPAGSPSVDSITRISVEGRRDGSGDMKIPQLAALLSPYITLHLAK